MTGMLRDPRHWLAVLGLGCAAVLHGVQASEMQAAAESPVSAAAEAGPSVGESAASGTDAGAPLLPSVPALTEATRREPIRLEPAPARPRLPPLSIPQSGWSELSAGQKRVLEPFAAKWSELPLNERRAWSDLASRFPQMTPEEQARVQRRIGEWARLTPDQRRMARANYRMLQQVGRDNLQADWERYQAMTPEQRAVIDAVGSTSNTAARHVGSRTGLAKEAAQPLPRRQPSKPLLATDPDNRSVPAAGVSTTVGTPSPR